MEMLLLGRMEGRELCSCWRKGELKEQSRGGSIWWEHNIHGELRPGGTVLKEVTLTPRLIKQVYRVVLLKLKCSYSSSEDLVKMQFLIPLVWGGAVDSTFLTCC